MKRFPRLPEQLFVFSGFFIFFLCTLAENFSGPHDSIGYLNGIVKGNALFHQHHLVYHFITHYWLVLTSALFPGIKDYYLVEAFTALWGSASLTVAYSFFRNRFGLSAIQSIISTSVIAFTYGVWFYSVNIEVYAPPMFFLLLALYMLTKKDVSAKDIWLAALLQCLAVLFHQVHVLFTVVILYKIWEQRKKFNLVKNLLIYAVTGIVLVGGAYFVVGWIVEGQNSVALWMRWLQGYAHSDSYWQPLSIKTPLYVATGYSHAFIGGHYFLRLPGMISYLDTASKEHSLSDELFLARHISETAAVVLVLLSIVLAAIMLLLLIRFIRRFKTINSSLGNIIAPLLITGLVYSVFFCFWEPEILEFWILQTILCWLLLLGALPVTGFPLRIKPIAGVALLSVLLFVINFFGSMRWLLHLDNDLYYTKIVPVKGTVKKEDAVLLQDGWILKDFLGYYTKAEILEAPVADSQRVSLDAAIQEHLFTGGKLYIYPEHRGQHPVSDTRYIDSLMTVYKDRLKTFHAANPLIYVVEPGVRSQ